MLKEEIFEEAAFEFGTSVGVAKISKIQPLDDYRDEIKDDVVFDKYKNELEINYIITDIIYLGLYKELQQTLWDIKVKRKTKIKDDLKLYRKAFKEITKDLEEY
jgi:hypothetical protein